MRVFTFDRKSARADFEREGWVHIPGGTSAEFHEFVRAQVAGGGVGGPVPRRGLSVSKEQFVLDLPGDADVLGDVFDVVAEVCGLDRSRLTLSERHVNVYAPDAAPEPRPHKDRFASKISLGISIEVPPGSHLVLWPDAATAPNPLQRPGLQDTALPEDRPEVTLAGAREVVVFDAPGDVQMFYGSSRWHTRRKPAGAVVLYFKLNDFGSDPLGEDPTTQHVSDRSRAIASDPGRLLDATAQLGRRFEAVTHEMALGAGQDWHNVVVCGQPPVRITASELALLEAVTDRLTIREVVETRRGEDSIPALCRLVELGAIDLHDAT